MPFPVKHFQVPLEAAARPRPVDRHEEDKEEEVEEEEGVKCSDVLADVSR